jgi:hypothetical protein
MYFIWKSESKSRTDSKGCQLVGQEPEEREKMSQEPDGGTLDVDEVSIVSQSIFP